MALKRYRVRVPAAPPTFFSDMNSGFISSSISVRPPFVFTKVFTRVLVDDELKDSTWEINDTGHTEKLITTRIR